MKRLCFILCVIWLLLFCGCAKQPVQEQSVQGVSAQEEPTQEEPAQEEPAQEEPEPEEPALETNSEPFAGGITLWAGSDVAMVNSVDVKMPAAPFVENEIFYIPLQFIAETLGWSYAQEEDTVTLRTSDHEVVLTIGTQAFTADGESGIVTGPYQHFAKDDTYTSEADESFAPIVRDGLIFMPLQFLSTKTDGKWIPIGYTYEMVPALNPASGYVIIGYGKENGIEGFFCGEQYDDLPAEQRASMEELGVVGVSRDFYNVTAYGRDGLVVHVLRLQDGYEDAEQLDGYISAVYTTNPDIPTPRGLRVGESISRIYTTYDSAFYNHFLCLTKDGVITKIFFHSYYDGMVPQSMYLHLDEADAEES